MSTPAKTRDWTSPSHDAEIVHYRAADGIAHRVTFLNEVSSLRELFGIADVQVFPADSPGEKMDLPMVLLEGMAEGVATVVAQKPPLTELVQAGVALAVPPMDPVGLAAAVVELLRVPERRHELAQAGRQLVEARYDVRQVASRYEDIYDEVLGQPRKGAPWNNIWGLA